MNRETLAKKIYEFCYLKGNFKLRSGQISHEYFDKYRFESQPELLLAVAEHLAPLIPKNIDALAGLEMGGIPIATALSLKTGLPVVFVRKKAKDYGTEKLAEGLNITDKRLLVIEDVITTGGQVILSTDDLRKAGAQVDNVLCVIQRGEDLSEFEKKSLKLQSLYTMKELKNFGSSE
ncbi:MAG: orotate phosphoribosyltransferase [Bdellovibrionales bacterium]